jgi:hypothetical protein
MALNPALRAMVSQATAKYQTDAEPGRGIIPLAAEPIDRHTEAVCMVASMIDRALTGPAIGVYELAERIVGEVSVILLGED